MNITTLKKILLRLFNDYIKKHLFKVIIALFLSFGVAGGTASIAWLLDPAIKKIFVEQIALSKDLDLPIVIHNRNSNDDLIDILVKHEPKGVVHCFSGDISLAQKLIDLGLYLSFTGIITFKNSNLSDVIKGIDINQIMIETDSPYLTPEPHRGKRNEPSYVKIIAEKIAEIRNMNIENVVSTTTKNAFRLFQRIK